MSKTKKITGIALFTALYVVLSAFLKITLFSNIMLDLGYIAFAVALCAFGLPGAVVGVAGCALESILFSAYGFSIGWAIANLIIGIGCGIIFQKTDKLWIRILAIILSCVVGLLGAKTLIECALYHLPILIKLGKSAVAFAADSIMMIIGTILYPRLRPNKRKEICDVS